MKLLHISHDSRFHSGVLSIVGHSSDRSWSRKKTARNVRISVITYEAGARNKFHGHSFDQRVIVTEGAGIVQAGGQDGHLVVAGDIIFLPADERHIHAPATPPDIELHNCHDLRLYRNLGSPL